VEQAIKRSGVERKKIGAVGVTIGPGLAIALEVGIRQAKNVAGFLNKPLVVVNHIEGHIFSAMARRPVKSGRGTADVNIRFPAWALVVSGGHTELIWVEAPGKYKVAARTLDDALGEALDKGARMLGLGYPGGAVLEKLARRGDPNSYPLPLPMSGQEKRRKFSYSGLKTAMWRLIEKVKESKDALNAEQIENLAAVYQERAFDHLIRVSRAILVSERNEAQDMLCGGGVASNLSLRKKLRVLTKEAGVKLRLPYSARLCGDNAAMIGVAASFKAVEGKFASDIGLVDRNPDWKIDDPVIS